jgi:hypothetical protein
VKMFLSFACVITVRDVAMVCEGCGRLNEEEEEGEGEGEDEGEGEGEGEGEESEDEIADEE